MEELVLVGGGVAGLSCLNALLDRGVSPLLLEASTIGTPKMCGEFLAPPAVSVLEQWGIGPMPAVKQVHFLGNKHALQVAFTRPAAAFARHQVEIELAARAEKKGGRIILRSPIKTITPATERSPYLLHLASGDTIQAQHVIFATGAFSQGILSPGAPKYMGFKTHIQHVAHPETLLMLSLVGGYLGLVPISSETSNVTCLMKKELVDKAGGRAAFLTHLLNVNGPLKQCLNQVDLNAHPWLEGAAPGFGLKTIPSWPRAYWIGDALASIHPAIGYGFAHSVNSAMLAADCYLQQDALCYHQLMKRPMRFKLMASQSIHHLLQKPRLCGLMSPLIEKNHWISHLLLKKLDY